jgi:prepilin-type N-terminal cleavage/methylation domain-containing protein
VRPQRRLERRHPAICMNVVTVEAMFSRPRLSAAPKKNASAPSHDRIGRPGFRRAFTFFEVIVTLLLAAVLALIAVPVYNWAFSESSDRLAKVDALTFERNVRALANTELRAPSNSDIVTVIDSMTGSDDALSITVAGEGFDVTRDGRTFCVVLGDEANEKGTITAGSCS